MTSQPPHRHRLPPPRPQDGRALVARNTAVESIPDTTALTLAGRLWSRPWSRVLKVAGLAGLGVALLVAGINLFLSSDRVAEHVAARIEDRTGYRLAVNGAARLLFVPGPRIVITDAGLTTPVEKSAIRNLTVAKLTIDLGFGDLFGDELDVERVVLERPVLTVQTGMKTHAQLPRAESAPRNASRPRRVVKAQAGGAASRPSGDVRIGDLRIADLRIVDGTLIYKSHDGAGEERIEAIQANLRLPSLNAPLVGQGMFQWNSETADFSFELATPAHLRDTRRGNLQAAFDTPSMAARFDGSIIAAQELAGTGRLSVKTGSLPGLLSWLGQDIGLPPSVGDGEFESVVAWTREQVSLTDIRFASAHARGNGEAFVTLKEPRPHIRAALAVDHLNLDPLFDGMVPEARAQPQAEAEGIGQKGIGEKDAVRDVAQPRRPALAPNGDWFSKPGAVRPGKRRPVLSLAQKMPDADLAPPTTQPALPPRRPAPFDADINLNIRDARLGEVQFGPGALGFDFQDGILKSALGSMALYGGEANGTLNVDMRSAVPNFSGDLRFEGVQAGPLLSDAAQFELIAGRTKLTLSISGAGEDEAAIKSSLKGTGAFVVTDGAIEGLDITAFIRALGEGKLDLEQPADARTAFNDLGGSFTIEDGIARTSNLKMQSPLLKVSAEGEVDLRDSTLQVLAAPEITAGPEGRSGANDLAGLSVPVRIEGPLDRPRIQPEIGAVFANPESASRAVSRIGAALQKKFKGKQVGEFIGRLLGGDGGSAATPQALAPPQPAAPR